MRHANGCQIERLVTTSKRWQHWTSATVATLNICSTESLQRANHNWIPRYYGMNFIIRLSLCSRQYPITLSVYTYNARSQRTMHLTKGVSIHTTSTSIIDHVTYLRSNSEATNIKTRLNLSSPDGQQANRRSRKAMIPPSRIVWTLCISASPLAINSDVIIASPVQMFNTYYAICAYVLNTKDLKAGSVYALNKSYALNNGVRLTTRVYGTCDMKTTQSVWFTIKVNFECECFFAQWFK